MNKHHSLCLCNREASNLILKDTMSNCWRLEAAEREAVDRAERSIFGEGHTVRVCCETHMREIASQIVDGAVHSIVEGITDALTDGPPA